MYKAIYGLKDAPRAWRIKLHEVLLGFGLRQLYAEAELYCLHDRLRPARPGKESKSLSIADRRQQDTENAQEEPVTVDAKWLKSRRQKLHMILSTHVDDLKGGARKEIALKLLKHLEEKFGP